MCSTKYVFLIANMNYKVFIAEIECVVKDNHWWDWMSSKKYLLLRLNVQYNVLIAEIECVLLEAELSLWHSPIRVLTHTIVHKLREKFIQPYTH
jgi:hypothetical protein